MIITYHLIQSLCQNLLCEHCSLLKTSWASVCYLIIWDRSFSRHFKQGTEHITNNYLWFKISESRYSIVMQLNLMDKIIRSIRGMDQCNQIRSLIRKRGRGDHGVTHAFLSGRPSFSGTIPWIATNTSTGVKAGPVWAEPCHEQL